MRVALALAAAWALIAPAAPACAQTRLEQDVLAALNFARAHPAAYIDGLKQYRGFFHANLVTLPGQRDLLETVEGVAPVNEAIAYLEHREGLAPLDVGDTLAAAATDHVADQGRSGAVGHGGRGGTSPSDRAMAHGGGRYVAEVITYGSTDAVDVVRQLIVDDGVSDRGHRAILFSDRLRFAGVSCGPHPVYRTMCVIDLAETADGREADLPRFNIASR